MFLDSKIGFLLLLTHFLAALLVGVIFRFYPFYFKPFKKHQSQNNTLFSKKNKSSVIIKSSPSPLLYEQKSTNKKLIENNKSINLDICSKNKNNKLQESLNNKNFNSKSSQLPNDKKRLRLSDLGGVMGEGIKNSVSTLLLICGFLVIFCVVGTILDKIGITMWIATLLQKAFIFLGFPEEFANEVATGSFKGFLEITSGIKLLSNISIDINTLLPLVASILGFGGISVHMQVASIISKTDLSIKPYLLGKTLHGIFAGIITYFILNYTNFFQLEAVETFSSMAFNQISGITGSGNLLIIAFTGIILLCLTLLLFYKKSLHVK